MLLAELLRDCWLQVGVDLPQPLEGHLEGHCCRKLAVQEALWPRGKQPVGNNCLAAACIAHPLLAYSLPQQSILSSHPRVTCSISPGIQETDTNALCVSLVCRSLLL